jgi:hypothetical protein
MSASGLTRKTDIPAALPKGAKKAAVEAVAEQNPVYCTQLGPCSFPAERSSCVPDQIDQYSRNRFSAVGVGGCLP